MADTENTEIQTEPEIQTTNTEPVNIPVTWQTKLQKFSQRIGETLVEIFPCIHALCGVDRDTSSSVI